MRSKSSDDTAPDRIATSGYVKSASVAVCAIADALS
jgi:hypothetical protein